MTTQTRRVYIPITSLRPEACFEVTRTRAHIHDFWDYSAELISGDVDWEELWDAQQGAIEQAREEWASAAYAAVAERIARVG